MSACRLTLLGGFAFVAGVGAELALPTRKDRQLLAYLALRAGQPQDRSRLAGLLWGDRGETQARDSLRQSLAALRQAFRAAGIDPLQADRDAVTLEAGAIAVDALIFAHLVDTEPAQAVACYAGELLAGLDGATPEYEAWLLPERERLNALAAQALARLVDSRAPAEVLSGIALGRRLLAQDPTREPVARAVMRLMVTQVDRSAALKVYGACRDALQRDLGVTPNAETEALYRQILTASTEPPAQAPGVQLPVTPDRPALAILPFRDLGGDGALDALGEVLGEELITGLGRFPEFLVIDRGSAAGVASTTADLAEIGRKLAVGLLVQGSLQRQGKSARITVRLIDAATRAQIWGEAFDYALSDILALPDRAISAIISTLHGRVEHSLLSRKRAHPDLAAYECLLRGRKHLRGYGPDDNARAIALFDRAIALDPDYRLARLYRAFADVVVNGYDSAPASVLDAALTAGLEATETEGEDGRCHFLLGLILGVRGDVEREAGCYRRALEINPNDADATAASGLPLAATGHAEEGIERFRLAMRLNPYHPEWYWEDLGSVLYLAGRYEDAVEALRRRGRPSLYAGSRLAASFAQLGRVSEAEAAKASLLAAIPGFSIGKLAMRGWGQTQAEHFRQGMRKAGLPE
jgi:DNA-binding SARP family transcriptional activator